MFQQFKKNIYSQDGEDGIIEEILSRFKLDELDKTCVEFGASDGITISNTYNLIKNKNYKALLIEPDRIKFNKLKKNIPNNNIIKINEFVEYEGPNKLDNILTRFNFKINFDFLSIDIDGNDYHIFDSLVKFQPKIICIEYNDQIPNEVIFIQENKKRLKQGSSALAIINLAVKKNIH
jgi:mRNA-degrading endonuclease HigB of HigAB toxin-antitoxin module